MDIIIASISVAVLIAIAVVAFALKKKGSNKGIGSIVGEKCVVTEEIDNFRGCGQASVNGQNWSARGVGENDHFAKGEVLRIVAIEGVKLICKKDA